MPWHSRKLWLERPFLNLSRRWPIVLMVVVTVESVGMGHQVVEGRGGAKLSLDIADNRQRAHLNNSRWNKPLTQ